MKLILLSGNSKNTESWILAVSEILKPLFEEGYIQYYEHWKTDKKIIDLDLELSKLVEYIGNKEDYVIFAKSAGTILTLKGVSERKINPLKCIFMGLPIMWCQNEHIPLDHLIKNYTTPTLFIQKINDPLGGSEDVRELLKKSHVRNETFIEIPGEDHHYEDLKQLYDLTSDFLKST